MVVSDASYYIFSEKGNKGSQMGHTKKNILKKHSKFFSILSFFAEMEDSGLTLTDIIGLEGLTIIDLMAAIYFLKLFSKFDF